MGAFLGEMKVKGEAAVYLGRVVDKEHFRVFVYSATGEAKLVESWGNFEELMESGIWFSTKQEADSIKPVKEKPKTQAKYEKI